MPPGEEAKPEPSQVQSPEEMSTPTSPTDTRHPLSRYEAASTQDSGLSESYQSTDTVRRRPEPQSYGLFTIPHLVYK